MQGVELNDRLMALAEDGALRGVAEPARANGAELPAQVQPLVQSLAAIAPASGAGVWVSLSPPMDPATPGEVLRQLRAAGHDVHGFVDRAALLAASMQWSGQLVVLDLARRHLGISVAAGDGAGAALRRNVPLGGGAQALHDAWLELAAATLVQQTRFDPLHDQQHETMLRAQLPAMAASAQRDGQASCSLETPTGTLQVSLTRDQLAAAAGAWLRPLGAALQALSAASDDSALLVPESMLEIPGFDEALAGARFARLYRCPDGQGAVAASLLPAAAPVAGGGVPYRTELPVFTAPVEGGVQPLLLQGADPDVMATHLVYRGRVLPIPAAGIVIGRDPGEAQGLKLPDGIAGLSRRHCTLRREGTRTQLIDHSSHGSFLDGVRVRGRALLPAGSTLRLGDPGIELSLVALDTGGAG